MKKRIIILIEEEVIRQAKRLAAKEGRTLSNVIQDVLVFYLRANSLDYKKRLKAYKLFCGQPMRINKEQFKEILKEESFRPL